MSQGMEPLNRAVGPRELQVCDRQAGWPRRCPWPPVGLLSGVRLWCLHVGWWLLVPRDPEPLAVLRPSFCRQVFALSEGLSAHLFLLLSEAVHRKGKGGTDALSWGHLEPGKEKLLP